MHKYLKLKAKNATQVRNGQDTGGSSEPTATSDGSKIQSVCKKKKERLNLWVRIKKMNQNAALSHTILKMEDM